MEPPTEDSLRKGSKGADDSSDEDDELSDAEYAQLLQTQLALTESEEEQAPNVAPAADQQDQVGPFAFNRGVVVFNVGRFVFPEARRRSQNAAIFSCFALFFGVSNPLLTAPPTDAL